MGESANQIAARLCAASGKANGSFKSFVKVLLRDSERLLYYTGPNSVYPMQANSTLQDLWRMANAEDLEKVTEQVGQWLSDKKAP